MSAASARDYTPESWLLTGKFATILAAENGVRLDPELPGLKFLLGMQVEMYAGEEAPLPVSYLIARRAGRGLYIPLAPDWLIEP